MMTGLTDRLVAVGPGVVGILAGPGSGKTTALRSALLSWPGPRAAVDPEYQMRYRDRGITYMQVGDAWRALPRGAILAIDEIDRLIAAGPGPRRWALDILNLARPWGLHVIWTARRASAVPRDATAVARALLLGRTWEPLDLERLATWGVNDAQRALLPGLSPGRFLWVPLA